MHPDEKCIGCDRWTAVTGLGGTALCMQCQDEARFDPYFKKKLYTKKLSYGDYHYYDDEYSKEIEYNTAMAQRMWEEKRQFEKYESPASAASRRKAEEKRRKEAMALAKKQERCLAADKDRDCPECEMIGLCDPDDYLCIVCRDGKEAVAPGYMHHWKRAPQEQAA